MIFEEREKDTLSEAIDKFAGEYASEIDEDVPDNAARACMKTWGKLVKTAVDRGWKQAVRQSAVFKKTAAGPLWKEGTDDALSFARQADTPEMAGWFEFIKTAYNRAEDEDEVKKIASKIEDEGVGHDPDRRELGYWAAACACDGDLVKTAFFAPIKLEKEATTMTGATIGGAGGSVTGARTLMNRTPLNSNIEAATGALAGGLLGAGVGHVGDKAYEEAQDAPVHSKQPTPEQI